MDGSPVVGMEPAARKDPASRKEPASRKDPMSRKDKVKDVLNEARTLVLGAQVLVGFQYNAVFHPGFERLSNGAKWLVAGSLAGMLLVVALVMSSAPYHRITERGRDTRRLQRHVAHLMAAALAPFAIAIGLNLYVVSERLLGPAGAGALGGTATAAALALWYAAGLLWREPDPNEDTMPDDDTSLKDRIEHMLTELRVVLPGAQALLGFQFTAMLTDTFERMPEPLKIAHLVSLCAIALAVILLMAPAPFHRIAADGQASARVNRFGVNALIAAMVPLALGMTGDFYVVLSLVGHSARLALAGAAVLLAMFAALWFAVPMLSRR